MTHTAVEKKIPLCLKNILCINYLLAGCKHLGRPLIANSFGNVADMLKFRPSLIEWRNQQISKILQQCLSYWFVIDSSNLAELIQCFVCLVLPTVFLPDLNLRNETLHNMGIIPLGYTRTSETTVLFLFTSQTALDSLKTCTLSRNINLKAANLPCLVFTTTAARKTSWANTVNKPSSYCCSKIQGTTKHTGWDLEKRL